MFAKLAQPDGQLLAAPGNLIASELCIINGVDDQRFGFGASSSPSLLKSMSILTALAGAGRARPNSDSECVPPGGDDRG